VCIQQWRVQTKTVCVFNNEKYKL